MPYGQKMFGNFLPQRAFFGRMVFFLSVPCSRGQRNIYVVLQSTRTFFFEQIDPIQIYKQASILFYHLLNYVDT